MLISQYVLTKRESMQNKKTYKDIPTNFSHKDVFEEYKNEIQNINANVYAEIMGTTRQNVSVKLKSNSCLLIKEQLRLIEHLQKINATHTHLYEELYTTEADSVLSDNSKIPVKAEVSASCGHGCEVYNETPSDEFSLPNKLLDYFGANKRMTEIIYAEGDSMLPEIQANDMLLIDKSKTTIHDGQIYVFNYNGQPMCKQLKQSGDSIIAISKNPLYTPFIIDKTLHFCIIGRVVGSFHPVR